MNFKDSLKRNDYNTLSITIFSIHTLIFYFIFMRDRERGRKRGGRERRKERRERKEKRERETKREGRERREIRDEREKEKGQERDEKLLKKNNPKKSYVFMKDFFLLKFH